MNDNLNGQLTADWEIPPYARDALWLGGGNDKVQVEGAHGIFTLNAPAQALTLLWGGADGPSLTQLQWKTDNLGWDGSVRLGGYVDALHITELPGTDIPIAIIHFGGQPLKPDVTPYPAAGQRYHAPYPVPDFHGGIDDNVSEGVTTWLAPDDSALMPVVLDALMNKLRVHVLGKLADEAGGWHKHFALPVLLESLALFAP